MFTNPINEAMISEPMTPTPQMMALEAEILKSFHLPASMTSDEVARLIRHCLHLFGPSSTGLACIAPDGPNRYPHLKTLLANVAARLLDAEYEVHEIDESEHAAASTVIGHIDQTLQQVPLRQWREMKKLPTPSENQLLRLHLDLFQEPTYPLVVARWQTVVVAEMHSGTMQAKSSLSAFLTPLRHFTRYFPTDQLPATFANLSPAERNYHACQIRDFFADPARFSLVHRTRLDYAQTVIRALELSEPSARKGHWIWGARHRIADLDTDPPESTAQDDGYHREAYLAAARATAQSMGERPDTLEAAVEIEVDFGNHGEYVVPIIQLTGNEEASQADMVRAYYFSTDRTLMEGYRSPFDQRSSSLHMICALDRWAGEQPPSLISIELRLLLHLLLHTGRDLDWLLSVNFGRLPDSALSVEVPIYVPEANAIFCSPTVKLALPELSSSHPAHSAYQPIVPGRTLPLSPFAQKLIQRSLKLRHNPNASTSAALLFVTMDRKRITRTDVNALLFQPFTESMQTRQPELPSLTVGKLRRAFWTLYTYHGLAPEDAQFISDQYYLDLRAPLFYACRQAQALWAAYQTSHSAVCQSLTQVFRELHPDRAPATFDPTPQWSAGAGLPSKDIYYGACYRPRLEVLRQLVQTMIVSIHHEWKDADVRRRFDLLTYACAFGVSLGLGLRIGEAANLTWAAVDSAASTIAIEGKSDRFAEEFRVLPISQLLMKPLKLLEVWHMKLKLADTPESPFFQVFHGKATATPLTREQLWRQLRRWADVSGLEDSAFRWHALRHAVASHLLEINALTFAERSYFLGHTAGQQWLDELRVGERRLVFERFRTLIDQRLSQLGFNLNDLSLDQEAVHVSHPLPLTQLLNTLPPAPPQKVGPQVWAQVRGFVQHHLEKVSLSLDSQQKISGLHPQLLINWYHEYCDTRGGTSQTAYSRRQRQNIRRAFEFVRTVWNVLLNEPLLEVRNYPRAPRRSLVDMRALRAFRPSDLERLSRLFTQRLAEEGIVTAHSRNPLSKLNDDDRHLIKFYNLAFALIAFVGVTMPGCFANFCRLQRKHMPQRWQDQLTIPRSPSGDLWISVALDDWTRLNLAGLLCHLSRQPKHRGIRRRQLRSLTPEMFLIGACPTPQRIRQLREGFNHWLKDLCLEAGVPTLTLERLAQVAQIRLPDLYSAEVIESLTGHITYHPLPPDQAALDNGLLSTYRVEIDLPRWRDAKGLAALSPSLPKQSTRDKTTRPVTDISDANVDATLDEELVNSLIAVCRPFVQKTITASQLAQRLEAWARECLSITNQEQALPVLLKEQFEQMASSSVSSTAIQRFNLACIAAWLVWRLQSGAKGEKRIRNVNTFLSYRRDALFLLRENPTMPLTELGDAEMELGIALDLSAQPMVGQPDRPRRRAPRPSLMITWHSLRLFLKKCVGLPLETDSSSRQKMNRTTHYTRLVEPAAVKQMLEICIRRGTAEAYCAYLGILLANYAGLRAIEIVRLRLSQIMATIYLTNLERTAPTPLGMF